MKEVWVFANWKTPDEQDRRMIVESGVSDVVLGIGLSRDKNLVRTMSNENILDTIKFLDSENIRNHLMVWVVRSSGFVEDVSKYLLSVLTFLKQNGKSTTSILYDAEKEWHQSNIIPIKVIPLLRKFQTDAKKIFSDLDFGVTGLAHLHNTLFPLIEICDYGLPQAYACWFPDSLTHGKKHWSHSLSTEPERVIDTAHKTWGVTKLPLVMGQANYFLTRPERFGLPTMGPIQNLSASINHLNDLGYTRIAYWDLKSMRSVAVREFIHGLSSSEYGCYGELHQTANKIESAQWLLAKIGYNLGKSGPEKNGIDGKWGKISQDALNKFRVFRHLDEILRGPVSLQDMFELVDYYRKKMKGV